MRKYKDPLYDITVGVQLSDQAPENEIGLHVWSDGEKRIYQTTMDTAVYIDLALSVAFSAGEEKTKRDLRKLLGIK